MKKKYSNKMIDKQDVLVDKDVDKKVVEYDIDDMLKNVDLEEIYRHQETYKQPSPSLPSEIDSFVYEFVGPKFTKDSKVYVCLSCGRYNISINRPLECVCHKPIYVIDKSKEI